jgi:hypothetical protein
MSFGATPQHLPEREQFLTPHLSMSQFHGPGWASVIF